MIIITITILSFNLVGTTQWLYGQSAMGWSHSLGGSSLPPVRNIMIQIHDDQLTILIMIDYDPANV